MYVHRHRHTHTHTPTAARNSSPLVNAFFAGSEKEESFMRKRVLNVRQSGHLICKKLPNRM